MNLLRLIPAFLAGTLLSVPTMAAQWIHLRTPHFELYTTNSEKESRELVDLLEGIQSFMNTLRFVQESASREPVRTPVRIVALSSRKEYEPFRLSPFAFGSFRHSRTCDYIVLQDIRPEHRQAAVHEYIHLILRQSGLRLPLWMNEGLADLYSSLSLDGFETQVGAILPTRMRVLESDSLICLKELMNVHRDSSFYRDRDKIPIFYAESWALIHLLAVSQEYAPGFFRFVDLVSKGFMPSTAFTEVYGKSLMDVEIALRAYLPRLPSCSVILNPMVVKRQDIEIVNSPGDEIEGKLLSESFLGVSQ